MNIELIWAFVICLVIIAGGAAMAQTKTENSNLTPVQQAIIPIAAFTANGDVSRLSEALRAGLDAGLSINDIKEVLVQMYAYCGFPRSLTALNTFMGVLRERKAKGINDPVGKEPNKLPANVDKFAIGEKIQTNLVGRPVAGPIYDFSPEIGVFLKEHLFCDIFSRNVLTNQERELATVSALAALPAEAQLASHLKVCLNTGLTAAQLKEYVEVLANKVGKPESELASRLLEGILKNNK